MLITAVPAVILELFKAQRRRWNVIRGQRNSHCVHTPAILRILPQRDGDVPFWNTLDFFASEFNSLVLESRALGSDSRIEISSIDGFCWQPYVGRRTVISFSQAIVS
jgi:hypothetical protein